MKLTSLTLLVLFGALLCAQLACAAGWRIHEECSAASAHHDHDGTCEWDACRQILDAPTAAKRFEETVDTLPAIDDTGSRMQPMTPAQPITPHLPAGNSTPRPTGAFPLLN